MALLHCLQHTRVCVRMLCCAVLCSTSLSFLHRGLSEGNSGILSILAHVLLRFLLLQRHFSTFALFLTFDLQQTTASREPQQERLDKARQRPSLLQCRKTAGCNSTLILALSGWNQGFLAVALIMCKWLQVAF